MLFLEFFETQSLKVTTIRSKNERYNFGRENSNEVSLHFEVIFQHRDINEVYFRRRLLYVYCTIIFME